MKQVIPKHISKDKKNRKTKPKSNYKPFHGGKPFKQKKLIDQKYGTSQLEKDFAKEFLDNNDIVYIYQYEAKEIGRFFDFAVTCYRDKTYLKENKDGINCVKQEGQYFDVSFFIEVDGDYWHVNPNKFKNKELTPTQKHNLFVDRQKDQYAALHCIPLVRIWEEDIRNNKQKVLEELQKYIDIGLKKKQIKENKKKPH